MTEKTSDTPELKTVFVNLPQSGYSVGWRMDIETERPERGALDNRVIPADGQYDTPPTNSGSYTSYWEVMPQLTNEIVGGRCTLRYRVTDYNGRSATNNAVFYIRGMNPKDVWVEDYLYNRLLLRGLTNYVPFARFMLRHESSQQGTNENGVLVWKAYNQFNAFNFNTVKAGTPNKTASTNDHGWGIGQITTNRFKSIGFVPTAVVWNWKTNINEVVRTLEDAQNTYLDHIGHFRNAYGNQSNWCEPPSTYTIEGITLPAEAWAVMIYYNGVDKAENGGVPKSKVPGYSKEFQSPWKFNEITGNWTFHQNKKGYATLIAIEMKTPSNFYTD